MNSRRKTQLAAAYFLLSLVLLLGPLYQRLGNHLEPRILGLPWSLSYVLLIVFSNFLVLLFLYKRHWVDSQEHEAFPIKNSRKALNDDE